MAHFFHMQTNGVNGVDWETEEAEDPAAKDYIPVPQRSGCRCVNSSVA